MTPSEECFNQSARWRTRSPRLLDCCDEETGRKEQFSPTCVFRFEPRVVCFLLRECLKLQRLGQKLKENCTKRHCFREGSTTFWIRSAHLCMRQQSPSSGHLSAADEAWYWLKHVQCSGCLCTTPRTVFLVCTCLKCHQLQKEFHPHCQ